MHCTSRCFGTKRRKAHLNQIEILPANIHYVLIGTGFLWFGWFGFNTGSALGANALAVSVFATTNTAAASAGFVAVPQSIFIGFIAAIISNYAVFLKSKSSLDDTLDVFPCHGVGGMVGILMTGIFKLISIMLPLRVSSEEEELGLDATQHNEKYLQGTLLVAEND
jgi:Amt family ammonium transporter